MKKYPLIIHIVYFILSFKFLSYTDWKLIYFWKENIKVYEKSVFESSINNAVIWFWLFFLFLAR